MRAHSRFAVACSTALLIEIAGMTASAESADAQRAPLVARATAIPACAVFVDQAAGEGGDGTVERPYAAIGTAISASRPEAVVCVAEGTYVESLSPGAKSFTLAGGFERGKSFKVRDSAAFATIAKGTGGSFLRFEGVGPGADKLIAVDGFDISGYGQAIYGDFAAAQRINLTNNFIHDNRCADPSLAGGAFALTNVSANIRANVFRANVCGRGGAGFINDAANSGTVVIESNLFDSNAAIEPTSSLGGALYLFAHRLAVRNNLFSGNTVAQRGAALYLGAFTSGGQQTSAVLHRNVYRANRAGVAGGGLHCDAGATCNSDAEVYDGNCGGNVLLSSGPPGSGPTVARFTQLTNTAALDPGCTGRGTGVRIEKNNDAPDAYTFSEARFRANAEGRDFVTSCSAGCANARVSVKASAVQQAFENGGIGITFEGTTEPPAQAVVLAPNAPAAPAFVPTPPSSAPLPPVRTAAPAPAQPPAAQTVPPPSIAQAPALAAVPASATPAAQREPALKRGASYMGFPERFNRYYTDPSWKPSKTIFVSPNGTGSGASRDRPMPPEAAVNSAKPGTMIVFLRGKYQGCFELGEENSGTYDEPVVLFAERNPDGSVGASVRCCSGGRQTCFNLESANYVAVDGFEMIGGQHGVRSVGSGFESSQHARGVAVLGCSAHDQTEDAFMSGHSDWAAWERNLAYDTGKGGHGFYLTNGGDWNIFRLNEALSTQAPAVEVASDPALTCTESGIKLTDARCDAYAGEGEGGRGASDYFLIDSNYFHGGIGAGPTFSGLRRSIVRNNIFSAPARHNVTFWQDTKNPKLASSDNKILHNLFVTTGPHALKFEKGATRNEVINNVIASVKTDGGKQLSNPKGLLLEVDASAAGNSYRSNLYSSGRLEGRTLGEAETQRDDYTPGWFEAFSLGKDARPENFLPSEGGPLLDKGAMLADAPIDRAGRPRSDPADLGPLERLLNNR